MGQTKCCWGHGPAAWMHHKDLSLPCFFTLLQNKLSLDCVFSPQAKLSPEPDTEVAGRSWLQVHPWPSLSSSAFFEFWWCFLPPSSGLVCLLPPPALSPPSSTFLHPSSMASTAPSTLSSPHFYTVQQHEPPNCLYSSAAPAPGSAQWSLFPPATLPQVCIALPELCDPHPASPLTYFPFQNFSCSLSLLAVVHPGQLWGPGLPTAMRAQGLWQSYSGLCQTRALLLLGIKPVAVPGTPLISPAFFLLLFYCRGPCFFRGERTKYGVSIPSCLSAFLLALCSFPCTRHKFSSGLSSHLWPCAVCSSLLHYSSSPLAQFLTCL